MSEQPSHDPQRTVDRPPVSDSTLTRDLTGAYLPAESTVPVLPAPPAGAPTIPGYAITAEIARGGMGRVYAGHDLTLDREVAIKTLLPGADAERFVIESKITARLPHPGIPPVHALGTLDDGSPFLAMKYVRGKTLSLLLKERASPRDDLSRFVQIFEQIAQAVGFAHAQRIIHRDLKPLNVMVGEFGEVQVMDWGLAKDLASRRRESTESSPHDVNLAHTSAGAIMGTPGYMAPEQARGESVDARADVFALGSILAAILTGRPAFVGTTVRESIDKAAKADLAEVSARLEGSGADAELIAVARHCLAAKAADRPAEARAVASQVATYRAGVEARLRQAEADATESRVREAEQRKRRKLFAMSAAAVMLVLIVGAAVSLWQASEARAATKAEAAQKKIADEKAELATKAEAATAAQLVKTQDAEAEAKAKTKEVEAALVIAGQRTKSLSDTYSDFVFSVTTQLEAQPGTQQLRRALLMKARTGLAKIIDDARKQGTADSTLVWSHFRMGEVEQQLGDTLAAQKEYQAGYELARRLADADPKNAIAQRDLSVSYRRLGDMTRQLGQTKEALDLYQKGLAVSQRLADADPKNAVAQRDLSLSFNKLGDVKRQLGQTKDALDSYQEMNAIQQRLADADPENAVAQRDLGASFVKFGDVKRQLGQTKDAFDFYQKYNVICQRLADADPKNASARRDLSVSFEKLGDVKRQLGQTKDALDFYLKMNVIQQRLADADPKNAIAHRDLAISFAKLGTIHQQLMEYPEAVKWFEKRIALVNAWPNPKALRLDGQFAERGLAACRKAEKALADLDFALKQPTAEVPGLLDIRVKVFVKKNDQKNLVATAAAYEKLAIADDRQLYGAARAWSQASGLAKDDAKLKEESAGKAMALLRKTPTGKSHLVDTPVKLAAHLKRDTDMNPLRGREDFEKLLGELEKK